MLNVQQFDEQAKAVLAGAYFVAQRYAHPSVDCPHFFLTLIEQTGSRVPVILDRLSVDSAALSARLDEMLRAHPVSDSRANRQQVFIAPAATAALRHVATEAEQLETEVVAPEHLLLALLREPEAALSGVLTEFGITHDRVQTVVRSL